MALELALAADESGRRMLHIDHLEAVVFDLDGVITQTAKTHAAAWKQTFDEYLEAHAGGNGDRFEPFDIESDYGEYVDGKPRLDGVRDFLDSRGIDLPFAAEGRVPEEETICGLGKRKNRLFLRKLDEDGVKVYDNTIRLVRKLRSAGAKTAVISSSRNCRRILEAAGLIDLFDAIIDGTDLDRLKLPGKPAPDIFIEAARQLGVETQHMAGVEDALAGVAAATAANYALVIGVDRHRRADALASHGADIVVEDLDELEVRTGDDAQKRNAGLPDALEYVDAILAAEDHRPALFLDFDGTLTPIVAHPEDATLSRAMRESLLHLAERCTVAIVSGRDLPDVRERVGIDQLWYAGSHGFDIAGPAGERHEFQQGRQFLPELDEAENALRHRLKNVDGSLVERKRFSIATHYRQVAKADVESLQHMVKEVHASHPGLRISEGKKVLELQPDIDWNKGKALDWLCDTLDIDADARTLIYIGDDVTDEHAFRAVQDSGAGILVAPDDRETLAAYRLDDTDAVRTFLDKIATRLESNPE